MDEAERSATAGTPKLPFDNLFLISGIVHGYNKASMYVMTILLFIFGYVGYQLIAFIPLLKRLFINGYSEADLVENPNLLFSSEALGMDKNLVLAIELGMFLFAFAGLYIGIRFIHRKTLTSVLTGYDRFRFGRFWFSFLLWTIFIVAFTLIAWFSNDGQMHVVFQPAGFVISAVIFLCFIPIQVAFEEIIFRGYIVQGLAQVFRNGIVPVLITSLLFGAAHLGNPEVQRHGWQVMFPYYCLNALFLGLITLLDEGLELAYGMHLANNMISGLLVTTPNTVIQPYTVFGAQSEHPQTEIFAWLVMALIAFALYRFRYKWNNFRLIIR